MRRESCVCIVILVAGAVAVSCRPSIAQFGPEIFSAPQPLTFASARMMGMGNISSVVVDVYSRNPAHAAWLDRPEANALYSRVSFDEGLDTDYQMYRYEFPVKWTRHKDGMQLVYFHLDSDRGRFTPPDSVMPFEVKLKDKGVYIGYGAMVTKRTAVGFSTAFRDSEARVYAPLYGGIQVAKADSDSLITPKLRVAFHHQADDRWDIGGIVTASDQRAHISGVPDFISPDTTDHYSQLDYDLGVAYRPNAKLTLAAEWMKRKLTSDSSINQFRYRDFGINLGAEVKASKEWEFRVGSHEGNLTLGLSYHGKGWRAEYAFVNNFESDDLGTYFGDAKLHTINVMKEF